jgi:serine/threonine-protein kinase
MAPEQAQNADRVDFRADVYGLGVTLYHAAVGQPPFPLDDKRHVLVLHRTEPVPPPQQVRPGVPEGLSRLLLWMLAKDPAKRPSSYEMLMAELKGLILGMV